MIPISSIIKTLGKFTARKLLRRTGVFGVYGTFKRFVGQEMTKTEFVKAVTKSIIKKNILRNLGPTNYFIDIFKKGGGIKYAMKQFGYQRMTPMAIKKIYYLYQNYSRVFGTKNPIQQQAKKEIWKKLRRSNTKNTDIWKLKQIELIEETTEVPKSFKKELLNDWFYFRVKSPQTHNFNRTWYRWNPSTGELFCSIRSGGNYKVYNYMFVEPDIQMIKAMVKTSNYGKMIYWKYYK